MKPMIHNLRNKIALFIVESPLQVMCTYEAIKLLQLQKVKVIARLADAGHNNKQMSLLIDDFLYDYDVKKVYLQPEKRSLKYIIIILLQLPIIIYFSLLGGNIFIGAFNSKFAKLLTWFIKPNKKIYLDDGVATLNCPRSILQKSYMFSIFDLQTPFYIKNEFVHFSKHLLKNKGNRKDVVIFIGSPIRQIESWIKGNYFKAILKVKEKYNTMDFLYFPHRREFKEDLDKISAYGIQVVTNDYPIEMFYLEFPDYHPKIVASLFSTAMFTMNLLYGSKVIMCDGVVGESNHSLDNVFDNIRKIDGIDIIDCEN